MPSEILENISLYCVINLANFRLIKKKYILKTENSTILIKNDTFILFYFFAFRDTKSDTLVFLRPETSNVATRVSERK